MDYESSQERLSTNPTHKRTGKRLPKETQEKVKEMLQDGSGAREINQVTGVNRTTVIAMRQNMESNSNSALGKSKLRLLCPRLSAVALPDF
jgi:transposase-like protein